MPSKGSPIVPMRIPKQLLDRIDQDIVRSLECDDIPRGTRTEWILAAIREVFRHRDAAKRSRKARQARQARERWQKEALAEAERQASRDEAE